MDRLLQMGSCTHFIFYLMNIRYWNYLLIHTSVFYCMAWFYWIKFKLLLCLVDKEIAGIRNFTKIIVKKYQKIDFYKVMTIKVKMMILKWVMDLMGKTRTIPKITKMIYKWMMKQNNIKNQLKSRNLKLRKINNLNRPPG